MNFPNTELAVRNWLRTKDDLLDLLQGPATSVGLQPAALIDLDPHPDLPCVVVYRAGGATSPYLPLDRAALSFDCWGTSRSRGSAMNLQVALLGVLDGMASESLDSNVFGYNALIESVVWAPDSGARARYVVSATVTARRVALAP